MTTIIQPPFWVPRPADHSYWQGNPRRSLTLRLLSGASFYGAPGQAPTKQWHYDYDVGETVWRAAPVRSALLSNLLTSLGQAKPRWQWNFDHDSSAVWTGQPIKSPLLSDLLTSLGQAKPRIAWYGIDQPPEWNGQLSRNSLLLGTPVAAPMANPPFRFGYDDTSIWVGSPLPAAALFVPPPIPPPGSGKRRGFPSYIPQPAYQAKKNQPFQPIWDRLRQAKREELVRQKLEWREAATRAPVPMPPSSIFDVPQQVSYPQPVQFAPGQSQRIAQQSRDAQDITDIQDVADVQDRDIADMQDMSDIMRLIGSME